MKIVVLRHRHLTQKAGSFLIDALGSVWARRGHSVTEVCALDRPLPEADLAIQHVNVTVVPEEYREACNHYGRVINGAVNDISKNVFSRSIIDRADAYDGPVIIKTLENFGGGVERRIRELEGEMPAPPGRHIDWRKVRSLREYRILKSARHVPPGVWENGKLIVEKYLPEVDADGNRSLRVWLFLGDREIHYRCVSRSRLIKSENTLRRENLPLDEVPPGLKEVRRRLGFDYGKFDYALNDGQAILYDVNKTPGLPNDFESDTTIMPKVDFLSDGLGYFTRPMQPG